MKKSILLIAVALGMLTACNPIKDDGSMDIDNFTSANLLDGATFSQYADEACTEAKADGNWIKYSVPKASSLYIYYLKADGSEFKLASSQGAGVFNFVPARGSDPNQTVYFKYINADLEETVASKDFTVEVAGELNPEIRLLASNDYGKKTWKWDPTVANTGGVVWGNMGYCGGAGADVGLAGNGQWWGVVAESETEAGSGNGFLQQLQHTEDGAYHGDGNVEASRMVFTEDGILTAYDADGNVIRSDSYAVEGYDPNGEWKVGDLVTKAILWPYEINSGGKVATSVASVAGVKLHSGTSLATPILVVWLLVTKVVRTGHGILVLMLMAMRLLFGVTWVTVVAQVLLLDSITKASGGVLLLRLRLRLAVAMASCSSYSTPTTVLLTVMRAWMPS